MRVPPGRLATKYDAVNRVSADFAQIYFPARDPANMAYTTATDDPWARPSRYAPLLHIICRQTACRLSYGYASLWHMLIQLAALYLSLVAAHRILGIKQYLLLSILLSNIILFLTPVGLSFIERGQFSVYVTLAYLWMFLGIKTRSPLYFLLSAIFAFIKWTSFPFIFVAVALWILDDLRNRPFKQAKYTILLAAIYPFAIELFLLLDIDNTIIFLKGLRAQEIASSPLGMSLATILPGSLIKVLPFMLVAVGTYLSWRRKNRDYDFYIPYLCAVGILMVVYPTVTYDYSTPCLLFLFPVFIYWIKEHSRRTDEAQENTKTGITIPPFSENRLPYISFISITVFLLATSLFMYVDRIVNLSREYEYYLAHIYLAAGLGFIALFLAHTRSPRPPLVAPAIEPDA